MGGVCWRARALSLGLTVQCLSPPSGKHKVLSEVRRARRLRSNLSPIGSAFGRSDSDCNHLNWPRDQLELECDLILRALSASLQLSAGSKFSRCRRRRPKQSTGALVTCCRQQRSNNSPNGKANELGDTRKQVFPSAWNFRASRALCSRDARPFVAGGLLEDKQTRARVCLVAAHNGKLLAQICPIDLDFDSPTFRLGSGARHTLKRLALRAEAITTLTFVRAQSTATTPPRGRAADWRPSSSLAACWARATLARDASGQNGAGQRGGHSMKSAANEELNYSHDEAQPQLANPARAGTQKVRRPQRGRLSQLRNLRHQRTRPTKNGRS